MARALLRGNDIRRDKRELMHVEESLLPGFYLELHFSGREREITSVSSMIHSTSFDPFYSGSDRRIYARPVSLTICAKFASSEELDFMDACRRVASNEASNVAVAAFSDG